MSELKKLYACSNLINESFGKDLYTKPCDWQFVPTIKFTLNDVHIEMLHNVNHQLILPRNYEKTITKKEMDYYKMKEIYGVWGTNVHKTLLKAIANNKNRCKQIFGSLTNPYVIPLRKEVFDYYNNNFTLEHVKDNIYRFARGNEYYRIIIVED